MTGPVVCGVDFSEDSRRALIWGDALAGRLGRPLVAVHAVEPWLAEAAEIAYGPDRLRTDLDADLRTFVASAGCRPPVERVIATGEAASVLRGTALGRGASMIALGTHGLGRASRVLFGSTTLRVLRESTVPVLAVPRQAAGQPDDVTRVVVGTDFGAAADAALKTALDLGRRLSVPVTLLHVVPSLEGRSRWSEAVAAAVERAVQTARVQVEALVSQAESATLTGDVRMGDVADVIVEAAARGGAMIVIGLGARDPHARPGTTAYRVLGEAEAPVLAVPGA